MKKVAIMQPYFFPYIGYFSLIHYVDQFILFDTPQFIRHGWIERNKVLKPNGESLYIKVPLVKHSRNTSIKDVKIRNNEKWKEKIQAQLTSYKKKAPNYFKVVELLNSAFEFQTDSIAELNSHTLKFLCEYMDVKTPITNWSGMSVEIKPVESPDEWALNICKALGVKEYINAEGGKDFFDLEKYRRNEINIRFLKSVPTTYQQFSSEFVPSLSIIDVMMFNNQSEIKSMLDNFTLSS